MMKKLFLILIAVLAGFSLGAQAPQGYEYVDSLVYVPTASLDSSMVGRSIFSVLPGNVSVHQNQSIATAFNQRVSSNAQRTISGYRVRIFFDNKQTSRADSEAAVERFRGLYPGIPAYRSYANPFFKVTVGDFRTKSEAMQLLERVKNVFPSAFVMKEKINYPVVDSNHSYVVDTVKVLRKIQEL